MCRHKGALLKQGFICEVKIIFKFFRGTKYFIDVYPSGIDTPLTLWKKHRLFFEYIFLYSFFSTILTVLFTPKCAAFSERPFHPVSASQEVCVCADEQN